MSARRNKAVVRRLIEEGLTGENVDLAYELTTPDYVNHGIPGGREGMKQMYSMILSATPNLKIHYKVEHMVAEGDYVAVRFTADITNDGKEATASELSEYRLVNGKVAEDWPAADLTALFEQIGVSIPSA